MVAFDGKAEEVIAVLPVLVPDALPAPVPLTVEELTGVAAGEALPLRVALGLCEELVDTLLLCVALGLWEELMDALLLGVFLVLRDALGDAEAREERDGEALAREVSEGMAVVLGMRVVRADAEEQGEAVADRVEEEEAVDAAEAVTLGVEEREGAVEAVAARVELPVEVGASEGVEREEGVREAEEAGVPVPSGDSVPLALCIEEAVGAALAEEHWLGLAVGVLGLEGVTRPVVDEEGRMEKEELALCVAALALGLLEESREGVEAALAL